MAKVDKMIDLVCANCSKPFKRSEKQHKKNSKKGADPCCSRSCSGSYGRKIGAPPSVLFSDKGSFIDI